MPTAITHDPIFNTPVSSTNTAVVRWSGTTGSTLQDCGVLIDGSNNLIIPAQGDLRLSDTTGGQYVALQANGTTTTHTLTFPAAQGGASTVLTNDGNGALTWAAAGGPSQADQAALEAETNEDTYAPPDLIKHSPGVAKAWVLYETVGGHAIVGGASYNMTSVTDGGATGNSDLLWATDFGSAYYTMGTMTEEATVTGFSSNTVATTGVTLIQNRTSGAAVDMNTPGIMVIAMGDQ